MLKQVRPLVAFCLLAAACGGDGFAGYQSPRKRLVEVTFVPGRRRPCQNLVWHTLAMVIIGPHHLLVFRASTLLVVAGALFLGTACQRVASPGSEETQAWVLDVQSCPLRGGAQARGVAGGHWWEVRVAGRPPNVGVWAAVDGREAGGMKSDRHSWGNLRQGMLSWSYDMFTGVAVAYGQLPGGGTAALLRYVDGGQQVLCPFGAGLGHGVLYGAGAVPQGRELSDIEIVAVDGTILGSLPIGDLVDGLKGRVPQAPGGWAVGTVIEVPAAAMGS